MRTKSTNFLQAVILLTGVIYFITGVIFYFSPVIFLGMFSIDVPESWLSGIQFDPLFAPLYYFAKCFAAILLTSGLSLILPLYDPLKYRGLVYYMGIVFPFLAFVSLIYKGFKSSYGVFPPVEINHMIMAIYSGIFLLILILMIVALTVTKKNAKAGIE